MKTTLSDTDLEKLDKTWFIETNWNDDVKTVVPDDPRLQEMYDTIVVLLDNLMMNPEKPTIHWPDRVEKIEAFKLKLQKIIGTPKPAGASPKKRRTKEQMTNGK